MRLHTRCGGKLTLGADAVCAAALLVQGSAHVYSKKVEYLHQLVYQALDVIHDRKCALQFCT